MRAISTSTAPSRCRCGRHAERRRLRREKSPGECVDRVESVEEPLVRLRAGDGHAVFHKKLTGSTSRPACRRAGKDRISSNRTGHACADAPLAGRQFKPPRRIRQPGGRRYDTSVRSAMQRPCSRAGTARQTISMTAWRRPICQRGRRTRP